MSLGARLVAMAAAMFGACSLLAASERFWPFTVDDTFISLRYAKHVAEGLGPSFNPGSEPVEGYTTVLWMLLLSAPHALGLDALWFAKAAGVVLTLGAFAMASRLALRLTDELSPTARGVACATPFALLAAYWPLALHAISGMETALAELLMTALGLASVAALALPDARRARVLAALALATALNRPECALSGGVLLGLQLALTSERKLLARAIVTCCIAPGLAYFVARYLYFGLLFPLPFYVKAAGQEAFAGADEVATFFAPFVSTRAHLGLLLALGVHRARRALPLLGGALAFVLFFLFPAHIMGFESRYLAPVVPTLAALIGVGAAHAAEFVQAALGPRQRPALVSVGGAALCLALALARFPAHEREAEERWIAYGEGIERAHARLGRELANSAERRRSIALLDVGAVAYYSEWKTLDTFGLNDVRVALSKRTDVDYVFADEPELLVLVSSLKDRYEPVFDWEEPLYRRALERGYHPERSLEFLPDYHLRVFRRGSSQAAAMTR